MSFKNRLGRLTCVCPLVALQFVRASEFLPTEGPAADEGSFSSVPAKVSSQVRCLTVHLPTTWHVTDMLLLLIGISEQEKGELTVILLLGYLMCATNLFLQFQKYCPPVFAYHATQIYFNRSLRLACIVIIPPPLSLASAFFIHQDYS